MYEPAHSEYDVIVIGAGAAGLMCAITAGQRGLRVLLLEHAKRIGKKILMSGGGRCNFTNLNTTAANFISANPHFCKSALARYTPWDFLALVDQHGISWHEKGPGQLFCDDSSKQIVAMLADEATRAGVEIRTQCDIQSVTQQHDFQLRTSLGAFAAPKLVIASGGLSIPKMGATDFGHRLARQFGLNVLPLRAGLVPFTLAEPERSAWAELAGVSVDVHARSDSADFHEHMLFTHRGLSGPAILQLSSYWQPGEPIYTHLLPDLDVTAWLDQQRQERPRQNLLNALGTLFSRRLADCFIQQRLAGLCNGETRIADLTSAAMHALITQLQSLRWLPNGTEGYRTAEVTLGGVDTDELSSQTMQAKKVDGLYLIGEVVDVTGQLGGYNFQWAWASGFCAGQAL